MFLTLALPIARASWPSPVPAPHARDDIVTRRVDLSFAAVRGALESTSPTSVPLGAHGVLRILGPMTRAEAGRQAWVAEARLDGRGLRLARYARVQIEVSAYSISGCEVLVRPRCQNVHRWGARRQRRYFDLAHRAATAMATLLTPTA